MFQPARRPCEGLPISTSANSWILLIIAYPFSGTGEQRGSGREKKQIMTALRYLAQMPQRLPFVDEEYLNQSQYHKMYVEKWYFVLYQILDDTVYVEYILDCRKDYHWLIR